MQSVPRLLLGLAAVAALGCASTLEPAEVNPDEFAGAPEWVTNDCSEFVEDDELCGVGSMNGSRNVALSRTTAIARARTEIARTLGVRVKSMLKDYQATTSGGVEFGNSAADEQHVADVSKQITDFTLSGTQMKEMWISQSGTFYALVSIDVESFQDSLSKMTQLSEQVRRAVDRRADKAFRELDRETRQARRR